MTKHIKFTGKREYLFERDAVRFAAVVDGQPIWCVISEEAITSGGLPCSNAVDVLKVFDGRFGKIEAIARRKIEKAAPGEEVAIVRADFEHD